MQSVGRYASFQGRRTHPNLKSLTTEHYFFLTLFAGHNLITSHRSHGWDRQQHAAFEAELASRREAHGIPANGHEQVDAEMPGEVTVEVGPNDIILREGTIYHASHANSTTDGRLMQHWCASTSACSCALAS